MINLAEAYKDTGDLIRALALYRRTLKRCKAKLGDKHPFTATSMAVLVLALLEDQSFAEAEALCRECLAVREEILPDHWLLYNSKTLLGRSLLGQKKYAAAEPLLLAGYNGMKKREHKIAIGNKVRLREAVAALVQLYEATGRKQDTARWKPELIRRQAAEKARLVDLVPAKVKKASRKPPVRARRPSKKALQP